MKRILIIAGGTGGHIFPALAVAHLLKEKGMQVEWLGTEYGMEKQLVPLFFPLHMLPVRALRGKNILQKLFSVVRLFRSIISSFQIIRMFNPDVVLSMGGYASGPGSIVARCLGKKLIIHEQNAAPGLTNRILSHVAHVVLTGFPNTFSKKINAITVGNPVRNSILNIVRGDQYYAHRKKPWRVLVLGGSQGAQFINQIIVNWLKQETHQDDFEVWHQTGKKDFDVIKNEYKKAHFKITNLMDDIPCVGASSVRKDAGPSHGWLISERQHKGVVHEVSNFEMDLVNPTICVTAFIENMDEAYAWADIVVARAGALTVSEVAAAAIPAIFIPYSHAVDDHQYKNALFLAEKNAALVFRESELSVSVFQEKITALFSDLLKLQSMSCNAKKIAVMNATQKITDIIMFDVVNRFTRNTRIYFSGIGGIGMCGLAELLHARGMTVLGSDVSTNEHVRYLQKLGITVFHAHDASQVKGADLLVYSSAVTKENPERRAAEENNIPMISRGQLLAEVMNAKCNIAVAGTHGKTTTTGLITWMLEKADCNPTSVIGGVLRDRGSPMRVGGDAFFVAESDESDASFLFLSPTVAVFTNIDEDHMETYEHNFDFLKKSFLTFANKIPKNGFAVVCIDDPELRQLIPLMQCRVITYGESHDADFRLLSFQQTGLTGAMTVQFHGRTETYQINLPGKHNALNAISACVIAHEYHIDSDAVKRALQSFPGMGRRFHYRGEIVLAHGTASLFDDYGHHPAELDVTIAAAKLAWPDRRLVMVFQPHRYSRTRDLMQDFAHVLKKADFVVLTDVYAASESFIPEADGRALFEAVKRAGQSQVIFIPTLTELSPALLHVLQQNDVVILQGAGDIVKITDVLLEG